MASHTTPQPLTRNLLARIVIALGVLFLLYLGLDFYLPTVWRYSHFDAEHYGHYWLPKWWLWGHLLGGSLALLLGPFQFIPALRKKYPVAHRRFGYLYLIGVAIGAGSSVYMGLYVAPNHAFGVSLQFLAAAWIVTSGMALLAAVRRQFATHREWMIRSYVVTFGFVFFRWGILQLHLFFGLGRQMASVMNAWTCWVVPLMITNVVLDWRRAMGPKRAPRLNE